MAPKIDSTLSKLEGSPASQPRKRLHKRKQPKHNPVKDVAKIGRRWGRPFRDCLPPEFRPRQVEHLDRRRYVLMQGSSSGLPETWSKLLIRWLSEFSRIESDYDQAIKILTAAVEYRRNTPGHANRRVEMILTSDVKKLVLESDGKVKNLEGKFAEAVDGLKLLGSGEEIL